MGDYYASWRQYFFETQLPMMLPGLKSLSVAPEFEVSSDWQKFLGTEISEVFLALKPLELRRLTVYVGGTEGYNGKV